MGAPTLRDQAECGECDEDYSDRSHSMQEMAIGECVDRFGTMLLKHYVLGGKAGRILVLHLKVEWIIGGLGLTLRSHLRVKPKCRSNRLVRLKSTPSSNFDSC